MIDIAFSPLFSVRIQTIKILARVKCDNAENRMDGHYNLEIRTEQMELISQMYIGIDRFVVVVVDFRRRFRRSLPQRCHR